MLKYYIYRLLKWRCKIFRQGIADSCVNETITHPLDADYGQHGIIIYPDLSVIKEIYLQLAKMQIEEKNGCFLIAPYYESTKQIRQILSEDDDLHQKISQYEKENILVIIDSMKIYFEKENILDFVYKILEYIHNIGKEGITVLTDLGCFLNNSKYNELVDYELTLPKKYDRSIKGICLYHEKDFDGLSDGQKQRLIDHHKEVIRITK